MNLTLRYFADLINHKNSTLTIPKFLWIYHFFSYNAIQILYFDIYSVSIYHLKNVQFTNRKQMKYFEILWSLFILIY